MKPTCPKCGGSLDSDRHRYCGLNPKKPWTAEEVARAYKVPLDRVVPAKTKPAAAEKSPVDPGAALESDDDELEASTDERDSWALDKDCNLTIDAEDDFAIEIPRERIHALLAFLNRTKPAWET